MLSDKLAMSENLELPATETALGSSDASMLMF